MLGFSLPVSTEITAVSDAQQTMDSEQKEHLLSHSFHSLPFRPTTLPAMLWAALQLHVHPPGGNEMS